MKILIIGGGNMGTTFAQSFLAAHIIRPKDLMILEKNTNRLAYLRSGNFGAIYDEAGDYIHNVDLLVLAVKPQNTPDLFPAIRPYLTPNQLVLSIMAGVRMSSIEEGLGVKKVIRAMPNLPAQVGMGMTAFTARQEVSRKELIEVQNLLSTTGKAIYFEDESMLDAATAVSGSGPAYVFYFMKSMIAAAEKLGFSETHAELLVWQTFMGAIHLHNKNDISPEEWIRRVSSKGGTTEAAIQTFQKRNLGEDIQDGVLAAFRRAEELGKA